MRINGEWFECDDGFVRPVVRGEILNANSIWEPAPFLVDTGADCTVFSAAILDVLGFDVTASNQRLGGVGGVAESVQVATQIRLPRDDGGTAIFRGQYAAFIQLEALDMSVLGRDIMECSQSSSIAATTLWCSFGNRIGMPSKQREPAFEIVV